MAGFIPTVFEFVPIAVLTALIIFVVLYIKQVGQQNLRSAGADICLGAVFIQITLLAAPIWASAAINVAGHIIVVTLTLLAWILSIWLLKKRKPSRIFSTHIGGKLFESINKSLNFRELLSFILGIFFLSISLMMMLNVIGFGSRDLTVQFTHLTLAVASSLVTGYAGYGIHRYLQNEQFAQQFDRFSSKITGDNVLITIQTGGSQIHERDPVQPVVDIIRGSIMKGVLGPSLFGLKILKERCIEIMATSGMRQQNLNKAALHFISHIYEISTLAMRMDEDEVAIESVKSMSEIGEAAVFKGLESAAEDILRKLIEMYDAVQLKEFEILNLAIIDAISRIGSASAAIGIEASALKASSMLGNVGASAVRDRQKTIMDTIITVLYVIGEASAINSLERTLKQTAVKLRDMGTSSVQSDMTDEALHIMSNLEKLGMAAASNKLELATEHVLWSIKDIGIACGYQHNEKGINAAVHAFAVIGLESDLRKMDDVFDQALWSLKEVCRYPIAEELENATRKSAHSFARLAAAESEKVEKSIQDLKQYFGSDETGRFSTFETLYSEEKKKTGAR